MRRGLGIDAGGSSTGWQLVAEDGTVLASGRTGGITGHLYRHDSTELSGEGEQTIGRLKELLAEAGAAGKPSGVVLGAAGLDGTGPAAAQLRSLISSELGLREEAVLVDNDMEIAYRGVFEPAEGVLVYAGTGSIAWHVPRSGPAIRVGGHGYLIDDAGGGFWIGRQALQHTLRWHDSLGAPSNRPLAREVYRQLGSSDWPDIRRHVYGEGRSAVAALARAVARAAARGDETALTISRQAGTELARLANVALQRLGVILPVGLAGGVLNLGEPLLEAFRAALPVGCEIRISDTDPAAAAAQLAVRLRSADPSN